MSSESKKHWDDLKRLIAMVPDDRGWMIQEKLIEACKIYGQAKFDDGYEAGADAHQDRL